METEDGWNGSTEREVKFLITMNMPSAQGYLVHQVTIEHPAASCAAFYEVLNHEDFILARQLYRRVYMNETTWTDRGDIILNSAHIGKVQEYVEYDRENGNDETYGNSDDRRHDPQGPRAAIRPRRGVLRSDI